MRPAAVLSLFFVSVSGVFSATAQVPATAFVNFEARQTRPICLSSDSKLLLAVNSADARLSVFNLGQTQPLLSKEIPVGIEPVSVSPRTNDEVWVVNELSDSISVVSVSLGLVTDTIYVKDEPADVVFAGNRAFVSVAGNNEVRVYDAITHTLVSTIPLEGQQPRAMAVNADGTRVYVVFAESGNRTTLIPYQNAPPQPSPTNTNLPAPPAVGLIVDATDPQWNPSVIKYNMPDNDVAEINTTTLQVSRYFPHIGTLNLGIAVQPSTGDLFVTNTDARNLVHFEPNLRAHFVDNRVTRIASSNGVATISDLNPGTDYNTLPNPTAQSIALAQPMGIVFDPSGTFAYVAAFGSDRVARINGTGTVTSRIDLSPGAINSRSKRGPRGLALDMPNGRLYVLNRISNTISVINASTDTVIGEFPVGAFDPTPTVIRNGRGFLYDARLSGNGTVSCGSCHLDGDTDRLAWDLGDPGGQMATVTGTPSIPNTPSQFPTHPMKGPMRTQTLKGLSNLAPLHWRADRATFDAFNPAFDSLMGGPQLAAADMDAYRQFIETIQFPPNPNQKLDRTLPASIAGGNPGAGLNTFLNEPYALNITCNACHLVNPGPGTNRSITSASFLREPQSMKVPQLRNAYKKIFFNNAAGATSLDGYGLTHDGAFSSIFQFLGTDVFVLIKNDTTRKTNLNSFLMCLDTGSAPAIGYSRTITSANVNDPALNTDWNLLQSQAGAGNIDLIVKGTLDGRRHGLLFQSASNSYTSDTTGLGPFSQAQLKTKVQAGDTMTFMGVPPGSGMRMGVDRDLNGELDGDGPPFTNYNAWTAYWLTPAEAADPNVGAVSADADRDGLTNLMEYALNLRPKFSDIGAGPVGQIGNGALSLTYTKILDAADIDYVVFESTDLQSWQPAAVTNEVLADNGRQQTIRAKLNNSAAKFVQLRVTKH
ncbi:MAG: beta-propeller fold lactonase family protein [Chthoniobacterales bacterium]